MACTYSRIEYGGRFLGILTPCFLNDTFGIADAVDHCNEFRKAPKGILIFSFS